MKQILDGNSRAEEIMETIEQKKKKNLSLNGRELFYFPAEFCHESFLM